MYLGTRRACHAGHWRAFCASTQQMRGGHPRLGSLLFWLDDSQTASCASPVTPVSVQVKGVGLARVPRR